jgi:hypothetical protein
MTSKLQEKPLHPALQNKIFPFSLFYGIFCYYDPELDLADEKLNADPHPQNCLQICNSCAEL